MDAHDTQRWRIAADHRCPLALRGGNFGPPVNGVSAISSQS
jgi:hypothetical protein